MSCIIIFPFLSTLYWNTKHASRINPKNIHLGLKSGQWHWSILSRPSKYLNIQTTLKRLKILWHFEPLTYETLIYKLGTHEFDLFCISTALLRPLYFDSRTVTFFVKSGFQIWPRKYNFGRSTETVELIRTLLFFNIQKKYTKSDTP